MIDRIGLMVPTKPKKDGDPGVPVPDEAESHQIGSQYLDPNSRHSFVRFARAPRTPDPVGTNLRAFTLNTGRISRAGTPDMWHLHSLSQSSIRPRRR